MKNFKNKFNRSLQDINMTKEAKRLNISQKTYNRFIELCKSSFMNKSEFIKLRYEDKIKFLEKYVNMPNKHYRKLIKDEYFSLSLENRIRYLKRHFKNQVLDFELELYSNGRIPRNTIIKYLNDDRDNLNAFEKFCKEEYFRMAKIHPEEFI